MPDLLASPQQYAPVLDAATVRIQLDYAPQDGFDSDNFQPAALQRCAEEPIDFPQIGLSPP